SASGTVKDCIAKAASTTSIAAVAPIVYDGLAHGVTASVSGAGKVTGGASVAYYQVAKDGTRTLLSGAPVAAGNYAAVATYAGDDNHNGSSDSVSFAITPRTLDGLSSATTQDALNLSKNGSVTFALNVNGMVGGQSVAQLFDGATFTLKMKTSASAATY